MLEENFSLSLSLWYSWYRLIMIPLNDLYKVIRNKEPARENTKEAHRSLVRQLCYYCLENTISESETTLSKIYDQDRKDDISNILQVVRPATSESSSLSRFLRHEREVRQVMHFFYVLDRHGTYFSNWGDYGVLEVSTIKLLKPSIN